MNILVKNQTGDQVFSIYTTTAQSPASFRVVMMVLIL